MARVREVKRLVCNECENELQKCSMCGDWFKDNDVVECMRDGMKHVCKDCME